MYSKLFLSLVGALAIAGCAHKPETAAATTTTPVATTTPPPARRAIVIDAAATPRVVVSDKGVSLTEKVQFDVGKAEVLAASDTLLAELVTVLKANSHLEQVEIEGHTSSEGGAERNKELSQQRADAVKAWLVKNGIDAGRLTAKGYGAEKPVADNATEEGREKNRRVDFTVLKETPFDAAAAPIK